MAMLHRQSLIREWYETEREARERKQTLDALFKITIGSGKLECKLLTKASGFPYYGVEYLYLIGVLA